MNWEAQLKLQALLDGELPEAEAGEVAKWPEQDREAAALLTELRQTGAALTGFEAGLQLPESREFFWSKIEREIQRLEKPAADRVPASFFARWQRFLVPATTVALLAIVGLVAMRQNGWPVLSTGVERETALADTGAFTYRDYSAGTTLVWLSYPAENELADDDETYVIE
jgi:anti-sigma factor RsiW